MSSLKQTFGKHIQKSINKEQSKDTGLALLLIFLILGYFTESAIYFSLGIITLILIMTIPVIFKPLAYVWLSFASLLGSFSSKIILSIVFFLVVMPIGYIRKLAGIDNLKLLQFKRGTESVMIQREHMYIGRDIEKPY